MADFTLEDLQKLHEELDKEYDLGLESMGAAVFPNRRCIDCGAPIVVSEPPYFPPLDRCEPVRRDACEKRRTKEGE